ncbi:MAG: imidazole glycerol phosphate synthase subunit HisH [Dehalococcoidia bacterium]|nr:imidazole glycerol phosphate synthase subunit HisH [Dehalococcoidia bacterium]
MLKSREGEAIAIINYGAGNLRSVVNAITSLGYQPEVTSRPDEIVNARAVILPGVGAAADTIENLRAMGLDILIRQLIDDGYPFLGVCIGLQVLFTGTEEGGWHECLGVLPGRVRKLPPGLKIPHMGWNQVKQLRPHPVFTDIPDRANFYFVHSYYVEPDDKSLSIGETEYGIPLCSVIARENLIATQFHPEKSGESGLKLYDNFIKLAMAGDR